jgi:hypothetical protein
MRAALFLSTSSFPSLPRSALASLGASLFPHATFPVFYVPTHLFTVVLWPGVALATLAFALFFWWVVRRF